MKNYRYAIQILLLGLFVRGYVACSEVDFSEVPKSPICTEDRDDCIVNPDSETVTINGSFSVDGYADILFVIDNSPSMSFEHKELAKRFEGFLESIQNIDYRIAVTTTDASKETKGWPHYGSLLMMPEGKKYMDRSTNDKLGVFRKAVERKETLACEKEIQNRKTTNNVINGSYRPAVKDPSLDTVCPSTDEQGIFVTNLVMERKDPDVFRDHGHLAVIIVSDEDERSYGGIKDDSPQLGDKNQPQSVVDTFKKYFPRLKGGFNAPYEHKTLAVHSIIIKPDDQEGCIAKQAAQIGLEDAVAGNHYAQLSSLTGGEIGSVCALNYTEQLGNIGKNVATRTSSFRLDCNAKDLVVHTDDPTVQHIQNEREVTFASPLPMGSTVTYTYTCPKNFE